MISRREARILAVQALYAWDFSRGDLEGLLELPWFEKRDSQLEEDLLFTRTLIKGSVEYLDEIDSLIARQSQNWEIDRFNRVDLAILRMSVYAMRWHPEIPLSVTINEAVEIAREFGTDDSYRFVNGILDGIRKNPEGA